MDMKAELARAAHIPAEINRCQNNHAEISTLVEALASRLAPVLMPADCGKALGESGKREVLPPVAEQMRDLATYQQMTIDSLNDLLQRLEV